MAAPRFVTPLLPFYLRGREDATADFDTADVDLGRIAQQVAGGKDLCQACTEVVKRELAVDETDGTMDEWIEAEREEARRLGATAEEAYQEWCRGYVDEAAAQIAAEAVDVLWDLAEEEAKEPNRLSRKEAEDDLTRRLGAMTSGARFDADFGAAFDALDQKNGRTNYVFLSELRARLPQYSREEFDRGLNDLRRSRHYSLDSADGRHVRITAEQREGGLMEGGANLVYVAKYNPAGDAGGSYAAWYSTGRNDAASAWDVELLDEELDKAVRDYETRPSFGAQRRAEEAVATYWESVKDDAQESWMSEHKADARADKLDPKKAYKAWEDGMRSRYVEYATQEILRRVQG